MSLKERLNQEQQKEVKDVTEVQKPLETKKIQENSLGVIDALLFDNDINSIFVNGYNSIYILRNGKTYQSSINYKNDDELLELMKNTANKFGVELSENNPYALIPFKKGINLTLSVPPLSLKPTMILKCFKDYFASFEEFLEDKAISKEMALVFESLAFLRENVIITGAKSSFKTAFLSAMAKKILPNQKAFILDYSGEISHQDTNCANCNLLKIKDEKTKKQFLDSIFTLNTDKVFVNDSNEDIELFALEALNGYKGLTLTLEANSPEDAKEKLIETVLKLKPYLNFEEASKLVHKLFSLIIFLNRDEKGDIKVNSLSEIKEDSTLSTIFYINESKDFASSGITPKFFLEEHENSCLIGGNIFETNYRHTLQINSQQSNEIKKNIDLLEKFKKKSNEDEYDIDSIDDASLDNLLEENNDEQSL